MFSDIQNRFHSFFLGTFLVFIASFPFLLYSGYIFNGTSTRTINLVLAVELLVGILAFGLLFEKNQRISFARSPITITLAFFLLVITISGLFGVDFSSSFWSKATRTSGIFYLIHLGFFYLFLFPIFSNEKSKRIFLKTFIISSALFSIGALLGKEGFGIIFNSKPWSGFTFGNSTFAAMYLFASFLISIFYVISLSPERKHGWKYFFPSVFLINPFILNKDVFLGKVNIFHDPLSVVGSANATSYAMFFSIILLFAIWLISQIQNKNIRRKIIFFAAFLGIFVTIFVVRSLLTTGGVLREIYLKQGTAARPILWELSEKVIKERPVFGWGPDNFDRAFESHYDNKLLEEKNGGEAWFDRAHNVFIDQTIDSGYIGVGVYILVYLTIFWCLIFVLLKAKEKKDQQLATILIVYFIGHLLELQTAFETTISYVSLTIMAVLAASLHHKISQENNISKELSLGGIWARLFGGVLMTSLLAAFFLGTIPFLRAQAANGQLSSVGSSEKRIPLYEQLFSLTLDKPAILHRTFSGLERGIALKPSIVTDQKRKEGFIKEFQLLIDEYDVYINKHQNDYRAHLEYAELMIYVKLFGVDYLAKTHEVLDAAIDLVPNTPQAYWMKSVTYLYQGKFKEAREWAQKGYNINPNIEESKRVLDYIERSIREFPEIDLFAFKKV